MARRFPPDFVLAVERLKKMRARFDRRKPLRGEFELLVLFDEETLPLSGLYQQIVVGDINVPNLLDAREESFMWAWIKGNEKWHAWNKCKGLSSQDALRLFIQGVENLEGRLEELVETWRDDQDPRVPDRHAWVPEEERAERERLMQHERAARRERDAVRRREEEKLGWWDED